MDEEIVRFEFSKSRSSKFNRVLSAAKTIPHFHDNQGTYTAYVDSVHDFCLHEDEIMFLLQHIFGWKMANILFYGKPYRTADDYHDFFQRLKREAGKYAPIIDGGSKVALDTVTIERLPFPVVYYPGLYGTFLGFAEDVGTPVYFCECERKAIENFFKLEDMTMERPISSDMAGLAMELDFPKTLIDEIKESRYVVVGEHLRFKERLCFHCNKTIPKKKYCLPMYGEQFAQTYGWYKNQEFYHLGLSRRSPWNSKMIEEDCPPPIQEALKQIIELSMNGNNGNETQQLIAELHNEINRTVENSAREKLGFKKIGEAWVCETIMFHVLEGIYGEKAVIRHYRPEWLDGLELDAFVPSSNIGFEYQGIQHFKPVEHWGGSCKLAVQQQHDAKKKKLCSEKSVHLVCINYDEPLTKEHITQRIFEDAGEWHPDQSIPYMMECMDDPTFFLHETVLIWPTLEEDNEGKRFKYMLNRGHDIHGEILELTENEITMKAADGSIHDGHTFHIRPMNETDLARYRFKHRRRDGWPHSLQELFDAYVEETKWV